MRRMAFVFVLPMVLLCAAGAFTRVGAGEVGPITASSWTLRNPTGFDYLDEPVRPHIPVPSEPFTVKQDGIPVPYQTETINGKPFVWVSVSMAKGIRKVFSFEAGERLVRDPKVAVRREGNAWTMDNGVIAARLPAEARGAAPPPLLSVRMPDGRWVGQGKWVTALPLKRFAATLIGDGQVFAKVRLRYEFDGLAGLDDKTPAFAEVDVALYPGRRHLVIEESHEMGRADAWEFDLCGGWNARTPILEVFDGGAGRPKAPGPLLTDLRPLGWDARALQARYDRGDPRLGNTLMWLIPKSNQHYEDGWLFAVTDGKSAAGAVPCLPGRWLWPHDNKIAVQAKETSDYAGLRCPTRRGARYWYLLLGVREDFTASSASDYVLKHAYKGLDKILVEYVTDWPGQDDKQGFYAGPFNPLASAFKVAGQSSGTDENPMMDLLTHAQVAMGPDMAGDHWRFWSCENLNFFSGYVGAHVTRLVPRMKEHPRYDELKRCAVQRVAEDIYYSITLPSGAGQECPGYQKRDAGKQLQWFEGLPMYDEMKKRVEAADRFLRRISYPDGGTRRFSPMGDSHPRAPAGMVGMPPMGIPPEEARTWTTEELQGYGVVFGADSGTPGETFLAFKSGPNRGHFHGDQLAFHYCANARPLAVDHHCSYNPRAGQEHMHNRVAFSTDEMPYANMDGYERVIAFKTSDDADIAVGQVESERLRFTQQFPPEDWDRDFPQVPFAKPLVYRRTVVFMKSGSGPSAEASGRKEHYFVFRDQYRADRALRAAYCLHVNAPGTLALDVDEAPGGNADGSAATFTDPRFDFFRAKTPAGATLVLTREGGETRHSVTSVVGRTLNLRDTPARGEGIPYRILDAQGKPLVSRPARYATVGRDGLFRDSETDFSQAGVKPGWHLLVRQGDRDRRFVIRSVEKRTLKLEGDPAAGFYTRYRILKTLVRTDRGRIPFDNLTLFHAIPAQARLVPFPWTHANGGLEETQGARLEIVGDSGEFVTVLYPGANPPPMSALPDGVKVGDDEVRFRGGIDEDSATTYVTVTRAGRQTAMLTGKEIDLDRFQGDIGLWVPNTGYPFGEIPNWLIRQRIKPPSWYEPMPPLGWRQAGTATSAGTILGLLPIAGK